MTDLERELSKHVDEAIAMEQTVLRLLDSVIYGMDDRESAGAARHKVETERHIDRLQRGWRCTGVRRRASARRAGSSGDDEERLRPTRGEKAAGRARRVRNRASRDRGVRAARSGWPSARATRRPRRPPARIWSKRAHGGENRGELGSFAELSLQEAGVAAAV